MNEIRTRFPEQKQNPNTATYRLSARHLKGQLETTVTDRKTTNWIKKAGPVIKMIFGCWRKFSSNTKY